MNFKLVGCLIAISTPCFAMIAQPESQVPAVSKHIQKILSHGDGLSERTAYKAASVHDEYLVVAALGLTSEQQSLVVKKKPYDVLRARDPRTNAVRDVWFDISSFYPEF